MSLLARPSQINIDRPSRLISSSFVEDINKQASRRSICRARNSPPLLFHRTSIYSYREDLVSRDGIPRIAINANTAIRNRLLFTGCVLLWRWLADHSDRLIAFVPNREDSAGGGRRRDGITGAAFEGGLFVEFRGSFAKVAVAKENSFLSN